MRAAVLICLLMFTLAARAEDWTTSDGKTYKDVKVLSHDDGFVTIMDSDGGATVPLRVLSPDLQTKFGYDAQKAAAREAAAAAQDKIDEANMASQRAVAAQQAAQAEQERKSHIVRPGSFSPLNLNTPFDGGLLQDGNFAQGSSRWEGDGLSPHDFGRTDPKTPFEPLTCKGLIVKLSSDSWTKIYQSFPSNKTTEYVLAMTYRIAADIDMSKNITDYVDIGKHVGIENLDRFATISGLPGQFYVTVGDTSGTIMALEVFGPVKGTNTVQTFTHTFPPLPPSDNKIVAICFPPGTGVVDILTVKVTGL